MPKSLLVLLPFATEGMLILNVLRGIRDRGVDSHVLILSRSAGAYKTDALGDFRENDRLLDFSETPIHKWTAEINKTIEERDIGTVLQVGAAPLYRCLAAVKERNSSIRTLDLIYNPVGHVIDHFLFENCIDDVIVESSFMRTMIRSSTMLPERSVIVVTSGVDLSRFTPAQAPESNGSFTVSFCGRLSEEKNPLGFLEFADRLLQRVPNAFVIMTGSGPMEEVVKTRAGAISRPDRFELRGYVPEVADVLRQSDLLCVPSKLDGRPVAVMEACACGVPVLATPVGGLPEMIEDGENGYLVPASDIGRMLDLVEQLARDRAGLGKLKRSARAYAERHFAYDRMLDGYANALRGGNA